MRKYEKLIFQGIGLVIVISVAFYLAEMAKETESLRNLIYDFGYLGVFVMAVISGFNLLVPIPTSAFVPLILEAGLDFWLSILVIVGGTTLADILAFYIGRIGREIVISPDNKVLKVIEKSRERYKYAPMLFVFLFASFIPLPNEVLVVPLGFLGYRLIGFLPFLMMGNLVFNIMYASLVVNVFEII